MGPLLIVLHSVVFVFLPSFNNSAKPSSWVARTTTQGRSYNKEVCWFCAPKAVALLLHRCSWLGPGSGGGGQGLKYSSMIGVPNTGMGGLRLLHERTVTLHHPRLSPSGRDWQWSERLIRKETLLSGAEWRCYGKDKHQKLCLVPVGWLIRLLYSGSLHAWLLEQSTPGLHLHLSTVELQLA